MDSKRLLVIKIAKEQRIRIPRQFTQGIEWLADAKDNVPAKAIFGNEGGIRIAPSFKIHEKIQDLLKEGQNTKIDENSGIGTLALARYYENVWEMNFGFEPNRFTLPFPDDLRDLGLLPSHPEFAVLWSRHSFLEIWTETNWIAHIQKTGTSIDEFLKLGRQELT